MTFCIASKIRYGYHKTLSTAWLQFKSIPPSKLVRWILDYLACSAGVVPTGEGTCNEGFKWHWRGQRWWGTGWVWDLGFDGHVWSLFTTETTAETSRLTLILKMLKIIISPLFLRLLTDFLVFWPPKNGNLPTFPFKISRTLWNHQRNYLILVRACANGQTPTELC